MLFLCENIFFSFGEFSLQPTINHHFRYSTYLINAGVGCKSKWDKSLFSCEVERKSSVKREKTHRFVAARFASLGRAEQSRAIPPPQPVITPDVAISIIVIISTTVDIIVVIQKMVFTPFALYAAAALHTVRTISHD